MSLKKLLSSLRGAKAHDAAPTSRTRSRSAPGPNPGSPSFFSNANGFHIGSFQYNESSGRGQEGWEVLTQHVAPNALYDSGSRFDSPKCDEDTRLEINAEIMQWIQDPAPSTRVLCLIGAAGAGKSAIQQTIAEKCAEVRISFASFFFSAADTTRNKVGPVVATIAYQLSLTSPLLKGLICATVERDPLIFEKTLQAQMQALIVEPIIQYQSLSSASKDFTYTILIDGLDECRDEAGQAELLLAINRRLLSPTLPVRFKVFVASRPEHAIFTALQPTGHLHDLAYHIQLNRDYDADSDIERYLWRRFGAIANQTSDPRAKTTGWPGEKIVNLLVENASGQFIYAATTIKYISERRSSPVERLHAVISWTPGASVAGKPFAALDTLYHNILSKARSNFSALEGSEGQDLLTILMAYDTIPDYSYGMSTWAWRSVFLNLTHGKLETLVTDLRSLMDVQKAGGPNKNESEQEGRLHIYHKSLFDFLEDAGRAGDLYTPESEVVTLILSLCFSHLTDAFLSIKREQELSKFSSGDDCYRDLISMLHSALLIGVPIIKAGQRSATSIEPAVRRFTRLGMWGMLKARNILDKEMLRNDILMVESLLRNLGVLDLAMEVATETRPWFAESMGSAERPLELYTRWLVA